MSKKLSFPICFQRHYNVLVQRFRNVLRTSFARWEYSEDKWFHPNSLVMCPIHLLSSPLGWFCECRHEFLKHVLYWKVLLLWMNSNIFALIMLIMLRGEVLHDNLHLNVLWCFTYVQNLCQCSELLSQLCWINIIAFGLWRILHLWKIFWHNRFL